MPMLLILDPTYATSTEVLTVTSCCTEAFHCCTWPEPSSPFTANTPCPSPAVGVGDSGATDGPLASTNAGLTVSSARCATVWRNGNVGVVNGVVMPAISIHTLA